jgi:hypothetical protein
MKNLIRWIVSQFRNLVGASAVTAPVPALVASAPVAMTVSAESVAKPLPEKLNPSTPVLDQTVRANVPVTKSFLGGMATALESARKRSVGRSFRAPDIMFRPHPTNARKVMIGDQVWKRAHRAETDTDGRIAYVRPNHPNGPRRFVPPRLPALAAA